MNKNKKILPSFMAILLMASMIFVQSPVLAASYLGYDNGTDNNADNQADQTPDNGDQQDNSADNTDHQGDTGSDNNSQDSGDNNKDQSPDQSKDNSNDVFHAIDNRPADLPEPKTSTDKEQKVQDVHDSLQDKIDNKDVENVEIKVDDDGDIDKMGEVEILDKNGHLESVEVPDSEKSSVLDIEHGDTTIRIKFDQDGNIVLEDGDNTIESELNIEYDPDTKLIHVVDAKDATKTQLDRMPSDLLKDISDNNKPDEIERITLTKDDTGNLLYEIEGQQARKFLGLFSVHAQVVTHLNATTGDVQSVAKPWYLRLFSWLFF